MTFECRRASRVRVVHGGIYVAVAAASLLAAGCDSGSGASRTATTTQSGPGKEYEMLSCVTVPEDLKWEYSYLFDANGNLKPLSEIKSIPADQNVGDNPVGGVTVLYGELSARYGHAPACGEPYPKGNSGQLNINALNHKALSCTDIPADLRQKYSALFDENGRLKSWRAIQATPASGGTLAVNSEDTITALYDEVVSRSGHPISCPKS